MYGSYRKRSSSSSQTCSLMTETACVFEELWTWSFLCFHNTAVFVKMYAALFMFKPPLRCWPVWRWDESAVFWVGGGLTSSCLGKKEVLSWDPMFFPLVETHFHQTLLVQNSNMNAFTALYLLWHINTFRMT